MTCPIISQLTLFFETIRQIMKERWLLPQYFLCLSVKIIYRISNTTTYLNSDHHQTSDKKN